MIAADLKLAYDRPTFVRELGIEPDPWQQDLLRTSSDRILLNCARQSGKSLMAALIALHRALYQPRSLCLTLAPAQRQAKETFGKVLESYRRLGNTVAPDSYRKLGMRAMTSSMVGMATKSGKGRRGIRRGLLWAEALARMSSMAGMEKITLTVWTVPLFGSILTAAVKLSSGTRSIAVKVGSDTWLTSSTTCRAVARRRSCHPRARSPILAALPWSSSLAPCCC